MFKHLIETLKDNRGFFVSGPVAAMIGAGALGGLGGWLGGKARAKAARPVEREITPIKPAGSFPAYQSAKDILGGMGGPASYADMYERELYGPERTQAMSDFERFTKPTIAGAYSGRGLGRSSLAGDAIGEAATTTGLELARRRGELRSRGLETGISERQRKINSLLQMLGMDISQANALTNQEMGYANYMAPQIQAHRAARADVLPTTIAGIGSGLQTGASLFGGSSLRELLARNRQRRAIQDRASEIETLYS